MAKANAIRHFLDLDEIDAKTLRRIIDAAHAMKAAGKRVPAKLRPKGIEDDVLVMVFEKPSTRTRVSFDVAMRQLGGQTIMLNQNDLQLGRGESIADTARVLSRYADAIMIRANSHDTLLDLAKHATVPVINGLTDKTHPCQIMADVMTFEEHVGPIKGRSIAWVGDGNNVAASWMHAAAKFGFELRVACPESAAPGRRSHRLGPPREGQRHHHDRSRQGRARRRLHRHRHLGLHGPDGCRPPQADPEALCGRRCPDGQGQRGRDLHALPARLSRPRGLAKACSKVRNRWSSTRPRTACTPRRASWRGASVRFEARKGARSIAAPPAPGVRRAECKTLRGIRPGTGKGPC